MTDEQKQWLAERPGFKSWHPHGAVSIYSWAQVGYLYPNGMFAPEGRSYNWAYPTHLMSSGDTLYVIPKGAMKVGRECMIA